MQGAISFEFRAATGSVRFAIEHGMRGSALELLRPIYDSFTEGFDTLDLMEAKALIEELS